MQKLSQINPRIIHSLAAFLELDSWNDLRMTCKDLHSAGSQVDMQPMLREALAQRCIRRIHEAQLDPLKYSNGISRILGSWLALTESSMRSATALRHPNVLELKRLSTVDRSDDVVEQEQQLLHKAMYSIYASHGRPVLEDYISPVPQEMIAAFEEESGRSSRAALLDEAAICPDSAATRDILPEAWACLIARAGQLQMQAYVGECIRRANVLAPPVSEEESVSPGYGNCTAHEIRATSAKPAEPKPSYTAEELGQPVAMPLFHAALLVLLTEGTAAATSATGDVPLLRPEAEQQPMALTTSAVYSKRNRYRQQRNNRPSTSRRGGVGVALKAAQRLPCTTMEFQRWGDDPIFFRPEARYLFSLRGGSTSSKWRQLQADPDRLADLTHALMGHSEHIRLDPLGIHDTPLLAQEEYVDCACNKPAEYPPNCRLGSYPARVFRYAHQNWQDAIEADREATSFRSDYATEIQMRDGDWESYTWRSQLICARQVLILLLFACATSVALWSLEASSASSGPRRYYMQKKYMWDPDLASNISVNAMIGGDIGSVDAIDEKLSVRGQYAARCLQHLVFSQSDARAGAIHMPRHSLDQTILSGTHVARSMTKTSKSSLSLQGRCSGSIEHQLADLRSIRQSYNPIGTPLAVRGTAMILLACTFVVYTFHAALNAAVECLVGNQQRGAREPHIACEAITRSVCILPRPVRDFAATHSWPYLHYVSYDAMGELYALVPFAVLIAASSCLSLVLTDDPLSRFAPPVWCDHLSVMPYIACILPVLGHVIVARPWDWMLSQLVDDRGCVLNFGDERSSVVAYMAGGEWLSVKSRWLYTGEVEQGHNDGVPRVYSRFGESARTGLIAVACLILVSLFDILFVLADQYGCFDVETLQSITSMQYKVVSKFTVAVVFCVFLQRRVGKTLQVRLYDIPLANASSRSADVWRWCERQVSIVYAFGTDILTQGHFAAGLLELPIQACFLETNANTVMQTVFMWLIVYYVLVLCSAWMHPINLSPKRTSRPPIGLISGSWAHQEARQIVDKAAAGSHSINGVHCQRKTRFTCQRPDNDIYLVQQGVAASIGRMQLLRATRLQAMVASAGRALVQAASAAAVPLSDISNAANLAFNSVGASQSDVCSLSRQFELSLFWQAEHRRLSRQAASSDRPLTADERDILRTCDRPMSDKLISYRAIQTQRAVYWLWDHCRGHEQAPYLGSAGEASSEDMVDRAADLLLGMVTLLDCEIRRRAPTRVYAGALTSEASAQALSSPSGDNSVTQRAARKRAALAHALRCIPRSKLLLLEAVDNQDSLSSMLQLWTRTVSDKEIGPLGLRDVEVASPQVHVLRKLYSRAVSAACQRITREGDEMERHAEEELAPEAKGGSGAAAAAGGVA